MKKKYTFDIATHGVYYAELNQKIPPGYCRELVNFIPTENNVQVRQGCTKVLDVSNDRRPSSIASYVFNNAVIVFYDDIIISVDGLNNAVSVVTNDIAYVGGIVTSTLETNNRLIVFRVNNPPYVIFFNGSSYEVAPMLFNDPQPLFTDFTGGARYSERLWLYKQGFNTVYYANNVLVYQGDFSPFTMDNRFNSRGRVLFLDVLGFSAGAVVENWLVCVMNSGDIMTFNGVQAPDLLGGDFQITQKITIQQRPLPVRLRYGSDLMIVTEEGFQPLSYILQADGLLKEFVLFSPVRSQYLKLSALYPVSIIGGGDKVILAFNGSSINLGFKVSSKAWFSIEGWQIQSSCNLLGKIYFLTSIPNGEKNGVYIAFDGANDNGDSIKTYYASDAIDAPSLGNPNDATGHSIQCLELQFNLQNNGSFKVNAGLSIDFEPPFLSPVDENFQTIVPWTAWNGLEWGVLNGTKWWNSQLQQRFTRFPSGGVGQYVQCVIEVNALYNLDFYLGTQSLFFTANTN